MQWVVSFLRRLVSAFPVDGFLRIFGINLISSECVFKQGKPSNCQSANRRSVAVTKDTNNLAICFEDSSSAPHICEDQTPHLNETAASCFIKTLSTCISRRRFVTGTRAHETHRTDRHSESTIYWFHDNPSLFQNSQAFRSQDLPFQTPIL